MQSFEEVYYELLETIQEFKQHLGNGSFEKPKDLENIAGVAWDKADELYKVLNSPEFEETMN